MMIFHSFVLRTGGVCLCVLDFSLLVFPTCKAVTESHLKVGESARLLRMTNSHLKVEVAFAETSERRLFMETGFGRGSAAR